MAIKRLEKKARWILLAFVIAASISVVNAALFVYYDIRIYAQGKEPPVIFEPGSNAGGQDLRGTFIEVSTDSTKTSLTITVHPTYRTHYYKDIARIVNQDSNTYYLAFKVKTPFQNLNKITEAKLKIFRGDTLVASINLLETNLQGWPIALPTGQLGKLRIDLYLVITPGPGDDHEHSPFSSDSAEVQLIYSPQDAEQPVESP